MKTSKREQRQQKRVAAGLRQIEKYEKLNRELSLRTREEKATGLSKKQIKKNKSAENRKVQLKRRAEAKKFLRDKAKERRKEYSNYINKSPLWKNLRNEILSERGLTCEKCKCSKTKGKLHIHHMTYIRLFKELKSDLMVLCVDCHKEVHAMPRKNNPYFI